jgi:hypothetical protein
MNRFPQGHITRRFDLFPQFLDVALMATPARVISKCVLGENGIGLPLHLLQQKIHPLPTSPVDAIQSENWSK